MLKKISLIILAALLIPLFAACVNDETSNPDDNQATVTITADGKTFTALLNSDRLEGAVIYDREYVKNSIVLPEAHAERDVYLVRPGATGGEYTVYGNSRESSYNYIPVNGFLLSVEKEFLNLKNNDTVTVADYTRPSPESTEFCIFRINRTERRIYLKNPSEIPTGEDIIVFLTEDYGKETQIPDGMSAYLLNKNSNTVYIIDEKTTVVPAGRSAMIFSGDYNMAYAEQYMKKGESFSMTNLSQVNSDFYTPKLSVGDKLYDIAGINTDTISDGIYIYDTDYVDMVTPEADCVSIAMSSTKVIYKANGSLVVPTERAVIAVFAGSAKEYAASIEPDTDIKAELADISYSKNSEKGIDLTYNLDSIPYTQYNGTRYADYLVIYNTGDTTRTNIYGYEISVDADGFMGAESYTGNMEIPRGGFVLSAHGTSRDALTKMYAFGAEVKINDSAKTVYVMTTPLTETASVRELYNTVYNQYLTQKSLYKDIDYKNGDEKYAVIQENLNKVNDYINTGNIKEAILAINTVKADIEVARFINYSDKTAENRAVWYAPVETNEQEVTQAINLMKKMNLNTLYIETWRNGETIFPIENDWTRQSPRFNGFDVLEAFVRIGHENGIEVHSWVHNFFIGTDRYMSDSNHIVSKTKQYHLITRTHTAYNPTEYGNFVFLDPYTQECRDFILDVYKQIITRYDIDGLHLDYMRFPEPNDYSETARDDFGYNDDIIAAFKQSQGTDVDPHTIFPGDALWTAWCKFRENIISSFVEEIYDMVLEINPDIWISCAVFTDLSTTPTTIFQNCKTWIDEGWMDEIFAMAYSRSVDYIISNTQDFISVVGQKSFYTVGLGAFQNYDEYIYIDQVEATRNLFVDGTAVFSLASVNNNTLCDFLSRSVHRTPAVQTYLLEKTLTAQLNSLIKRCDGIFTVAQVEQSLLDELKTSLSNILSLSASFNSDNSTYTEKLEFIAQAKAALNAVSISAISEASSDLGQAIKNDIDECIDCLVRSENRIHSKIK